MFDSPHLIKSVRNNLLKSKIEFDENKVAVWDHIRKFYNIDKSRRFRLARKLSDSHINPTPFQRMKVKLATQVISYTVASSLYTWATENTGEIGAQQTAEFLERFDRLFDLFNSSTSFDTKEFRRCFKGSEKQTQFLDETSIFLSKIKVINSKGQDITSKVHCFKGWELNINSLKLMYEHLNQDVLENSFGALRKGGGNNRNLTPYQFATLFKKSFSIRYMEVSQFGNCEEQPEMLLSPNKPVVTFPEILQPTDAFVFDKDYPQMDLGEQNAFVYFGGWVLKKFCENHNCIRKRVSAEGEGTSYIFTNFKQYDASKLMKPSEDFMNSLGKLEKVFLENFNDIALQSNMENKLYEKLKDQFTYYCCSQANLEYLVRLFIRVRIYYIIKFYNREVKIIDNRNKVLSVTHM